MKHGLGMVRGFWPIVNLVGLEKKRPIRIAPARASIHQELDKSDNIEGGKKILLSNLTSP
jgi:hypothetical protein